MASKIKILKQTPEYVAVHKPAGLVVYADSKEQEPLSCQRKLEAQLKGKKLFPVHRLDKTTCGVLVYAFSGRTAAQMAKAFQMRVTKKKYLAIVHGEIAKDGVIDKPLVKHKEKIEQDAKTHFYRLETCKISLEGEERSYSLVRLEPKTGRYHQLRRHLRMIDHPIVGDPEYGNEWDNRAIGHKFGIDRTMLSAVFVGFPSGDGAGFSYVSSQPDADFLRLVQGLGWKLKLQRCST